MVCYSDLRQVFPCRSMGARIMGYEAVKCQRTAAKRNLDVVRLSRMLTCAKLCLTGEQAVRTHHGDAVKPCSRWSDCGKGSQVPACEERVAAFKKACADRKFWKTALLDAKHSGLYQERQNLGKQLEIARQQQALFVTAQTAGNSTADEWQSRRDCLFR